MDPFYYIWNAATFKRSSCGSTLVVIVGLISMIFGAYTATEMMLCSQTESMPCVLRYGETRKVCPGDGVYTNLTLIVDPNIIPQNVSILWQGIQFSMGPVVSGPFHNGDEHINRWTNKISFQGNTMTYELWNSEIKFKDEFYCQIEIDIGGEKFISEDFKWFHVDSDNCPTNPPSIKDTTEQHYNITKQLDQLMVLLMNSSASDMAERKKMNINLIHLLSQLANNITEGSIQRAVKYSDQLSEMHEGLEDVKSKLDNQNNRLDTSNKMDITQIVVLVLLFIISLFITAKIFIPPKVQKDLQKKFSGLLNHIRCNNLSSSSTSVSSTVPSQSSSGLASRNQDKPSPNKEAKLLLQEDKETLLNLNPSDHSTVLSQSSSSLARRNQDKPSPNKEAKQLLQEHTETLLNLNPSEHSTVRSQSSSSLASGNQDEPSSDKKADPLLQGDTESFLNLNPSDEDRNIPDAILQKYTNGRPFTDAEQHCNIEMTNIE